MFIIAIISRIFDSFDAKICVIDTTTNTKIARYSKENRPRDVVIIKNQKVNPAEVANALKFDEESFILNWIYECYKT